jgi:signal transduction histidine kinase
LHVHVHLLIGSVEARRSRPLRLRWRQANAPGGCHPVTRDAGPLDAASATTNNFRNTSRRSITLEARDVEALRGSLDRLRLEVEELHASRKRLVQAADTERRTIERDLHEGVQQHLVGLAVNLQLASQLLDTDPATAKALLEEMGRDVQQALDETAQLAQRIYPPLLEAGGLAAALRAAAASIGIPVSVEVEAAAGCPPEVVRTVYLCCIGALEHAGAEARATITVRKEEEAIAFEVAEDGAWPVAAAARSDAGLDRLRDRVEALGGRLTVRSEPGRGTRVSGSLPLSR